MTMWKPIDGTPYEVSDAGGIRRGDLVLKPYPQKAGYLLITLSLGGKCYRRLVHRLILSAFVGPSHLQTNHKNAIKSDNRLENLEYVTASENRRHAQLAGLCAKKYKRHTHCSHGHELSDGNVRISKDRRGRSYQACLTCGRENQRRYDAIKRNSGRAAV